jgi:putative ABC transport system permease protein
MSLWSLIRVNLFRNKLRTILTFGSVMVALFLFCALNGVLDTLEDAIRVGSEQRLVTRNRISLVFPLPLAYRERITAVPGIESVSYANWFGGLDPANERDFYAQFAVDAPTYLAIYDRDVEIVAGEATGPVPAGLDPKLGAFFQERTAAVVGKKLFDRKQWKLG